MEEDIFDDELNEEAYMDEIIYHPEEGCQDAIILYPNTKVEYEDLGICGMEGLYCNWNEDEKELEPDFDLAIFFALDDEEYENHIYWENDPIEVALHNLKYAMGDELPLKIPAQQQQAA